MISIPRCTLLFLTLIVLLSSFTSMAQGQQKRNVLTWKKYHALCGLDSGDRIENFDKLKGKEIMWHGRVTEVEEDRSLYGSEVLAPKVIRVKMDPSDSMVADIRLQLPKDKLSTINKVRPGHEIIFKGTLASLGNTIRDHIVVVTKFGKYKPKPAK